MIELLHSLPDTDLPGLIILDYREPEAGEVEALNELRVNIRLKDIPKIIYSTSVSESCKELCVAANATAFLEKKSGFHELRDNIKQMLVFSNNYTE